LECAKLGKEVAKLTAQVKRLTEKSAELKRQTAELRAGPVSVSKPAPGKKDQATLEKLYLKQEERKTGGKKI
jgi:hypothetical protein